MKLYMEIKYRVAKIKEENSLKNLLIKNKQKPTIILGNNNLYYLAESKSEIIGMIGIELEDKFALIRSTAVLKNWRGRNIAQNLIKSIILVLKQKNIQTIYLFSIDSGTYWRKFGFEECDVKEIITNLPNTPQVIGYLKDGSIWTDIAWKVSLKKIMSHLDIIKSNEQNQLNINDSNPHFFNFKYSTK